MLVKAYILSLDLLGRFVDLIGSALAFALLVIQLPSEFDD
jgi:hypothetical protein